MGGKDANLGRLLVVVKISNLLEFQVKKIKMVEAYVGNFILSVWC